MRLRFVVFLFLLALGVSSTRSASAEEAAVPPKPRSSQAVPVLATGAALLTLSWPASAAVAFDAAVGYRRRCEQAQGARDANPTIDGLGLAVQAIIVCSEKPPERHLVHPVVGPWLTLAEGRWSSAQTTLLVADGIAQGLGVALMAAGLIKLTTERSPHEGPRFSVSPTLGGINAVAVF